MINKLAIMFMLIVCLQFYCRSQQTPLFNQYFLNPYLINPALTGLDGESKAFFHYRNQWAQVDGAPETHAFTLDGRLTRHKIGVGLAFFNDVSNIIGRFNGGLSASYTVDITTNQDLAFGMSLMAIQSRVFFDRIQTEDISDPNLLSRIDKRTVAEGNFGFSYRWKSLRLGFAADQIFQNEIRHENAAQLQVLDYNFVRHYITTIQHPFSLKHDLSLRPTILLRTIEGIPPQLEISSILDYRNLVWFGTSYRHKIGVGLSAGFEIDDQFVLSYTYEVPTTDLRFLGASTHEFVLGMRLRKKSTDNSIGVSSRDLKEIREVKDENAAQYEKLDELQKINEDQQKELDQYKEIIDLQLKEMQFLRNEYHSFETELDSLKSGVEYRQNPKTEEAPDSDYYLIVGAFRKIENAKLFQKILKRDAGLATWVIQNNRQSWYLIYSEQIEDLSTTNEKINQLENGAAQHLILGTPWVFEKER